MVKPRLRIDRRTAVVNRASKFVMPVLPGLSAALCGCAEIGRFTAEDAERAASIGADTSDAAGAACWPVIAAAANAVAASGDHPGVLTAIEEKRPTKMALANPACEPIWGGVLADLLKIAPTGSLVP